MPQYRPLGTVPAPASWLIPTASALTLEAAYAKFNGASTTGPWQPCLRIVSDSGDIVGEYPCSTSVAAGASADVSFFPGLAIPFTAVPGANIQTYAGESTAANYVYPASVHDTLLSSGYPANPTFTKISDTSLLLCHVEADFTADMAAPDFLYLRLALNGNNVQTVTQHVSVGGGAFVGIDLVRYIGIQPFGLAPFPAGAVTVDVQVGSHSGNSFTMLSQSATNMEIVEIQI